jgi:hypothetical protein
MPSFFQKSGVFLQILCKIFQNEHEKAIQMKKSTSFLQISCKIFQNEHEKAIQMKKMIWIQVSARGLCTADQ